MEPKKYWWILIQSTNENGSIRGYQEWTDDRHPFYHQHAIGKVEVVTDSGEIYKRTVVNWKPISVEEFNLFNQLNENK